MKIHRVPNRALAAAAVLLFGSWQGACQDHRGVARNDAEARCLDAGPEEAQNPVSLIACALDGGSGLRFFVGVRNLDPGPIRIRTRLEPFNEFEVHVREVGGEAVRPGDIWEPASLDLVHTTYLLPRGGVFGRTVDLACLQRDFGPELEPCAATYRPTPGEVEVWFRYVDLWVCFDDPCDEPRTWTGTVESRRVRVVVHEGQG